MKRDLVERLRVVWEAADAAFRTDPSYATEMVKDGRPDPEVDRTKLVSV